MRVNVDSKSCTGHGLCYEFSENVFTWDDDGNAKIIGDGNVAAEHAREATDAAAACPEGAITIED